MFSHAISAENRGDKFWIKLIIVKKGAFALALDADARASATFPRAKDANARASATFPRAKDAKAWASATFPWAKDAEAWAKDANAWATTTFILAFFTIYLLIQRTYFT